MSGVSVERLLKVLSSPINLAILSLVSSRPSYPREIARLLGRDETDVSKRLRILEDYGFVEGYWTRVSDRNIRMYRITRREVRIEFAEGSVNVNILDSNRSEPSKISIRVPSAMPKPGLIIGRDSLIEEISRLDTPVYVVWGLPGVGKSSLVARALEEYPVVFWYRGDSTETLDGFLWRIALHLSQLGYPDPLRILGSGPRARIIDEIINGLKSARTVMVIDDYHIVENTSIGDLVRSRLAREADGYKLILVSRSMPRGLPYHVTGRVMAIHVDLLSRDDALKLAMMHGASPEHAEIVYSIARGHPLLTIQLSRLDDVKDNIQDYLYSEILERLSPNEVRVVKTLSSLDMPVDSGVLEELLQSRTIDHTLLTLERKSLVERSPRGYILHELIRKNIPVSSEYRRRVLEEAGKILAYRESWPDRIRGIHLLIEAGKPEAAADIVARRLIEDDYTVWALAGDYLNVLEVLSKTVRDPARLVYVYTDRGRFTYRLKGAVDEALLLLEDAVRIARSIGDQLGLMIALSEYGFLLDEAGRHEEALHALLEAEGYIRSLVAAPRVAFGIYANLVKVFASNGMLDEAFRYLEKQWKAATLSGDELYTTATIVHKGSLKLVSGDYIEAARILSEALVQARELGLEALYYPALLDLLEAYDRIGAHESMLSLIEEAEGRGVAFRRGIIYYYRSRIDLAKGNIREALGNAYKALEEAIASDEWFLKPVIYAQLGLAYLVSGHVSEAVLVYRKACKANVPGYLKARFVEDLDKYIDDENIKHSIQELCGASY